MPDNVTLALDAETHDIIFSDGTLALISDTDAIAQNVRNTLLVYQGEFPLDEEHGTDYERIFRDKRISDEEIIEIVRDAIFQEDDVVEISSLLVERSSGERTLRISFKAVLQDGSTISEVIAL